MTLIMNCSRTNRSARFGLWLSVALAVVAAPALHAQAPLWLGDWYPVFDLQITLDNNINRSIDGDGEKRDLVIEPRLSLQHQYPLENEWVFSLEGYLAGAIHGKYHKLNHVVPGAIVGMSRFLGDGANAPLFIAQLGVRYEFHDQDARFGAEVNPRLETQFNLGDFLYSSIYYEYDNRFASENEIYDRDGHTIGLHIDVEVTPQYIFQLGYAYRYGDVLVHEPSDGPAPNIPGKVFPVDTFTAHYAALKFTNEDRHTLYVGAQYALSLYTTLDLRLVHEEIRANSDKYPSSQILFAVRHIL